MDDLPHRDEDRVLTLHSHYFLVAEVMLEDYDKLKQHINRLKNPRRLGWKLIIYYNTWLGFLGVTCEGWKNINMRRTLRKRPALFSELIPEADEINSVMNLNLDPLRKYRNSVFHLREDTKDVLEFLTGEGNKPQWAVSLHEDLKGFFSNYRALCQVYYALNDRNDEKFG